MGECEGDSVFWLCYSLLKYIICRRGSEFSSNTVPSAVEQTLSVLRQVEFFPVTVVHMVLQNGIIWQSAVTVFFHAIC